ncbi:MAG: hypothetical protein OXG42_03565 [Chloroflexi bacterium]|nr:hypothetical protein [Chloroflexota bacterium]
MAEWEIKAVGRDRAGNSLSFCGDEPFRWNVWIHDLIDDIEGRRHSYFVTGPFGRRVEVVIDITADGKIVRSHKDAGDDLLKQLPRC